MDNTFTEYQNIRFKKVKYIVEQSWKIGKMSLVSGFLKKKLLHLLLRFFPKKQYQKRFNRIINIDYLNKLEITLRAK